VIELIVGSSSEINIHRGARKRRSPGGQQQSALQDEPIGVWRSCEAIQESLHREILKQFLKWPAPGTGWFSRRWRTEAPTSSAHSMASR
jgi:hypothetical protein